MRYSQNGYGAQPTLIASYTVPGTNVRVSVRKGDASVVLLEVLRLYHTTVEPLRQKDTGGYNPRSIIGGNILSNHASGTAVDARWQDHPIGRRGTHTDKQRRAINAILDKMDGVIRWGGNYKGRPDDMHFEIVGTPAQLAKVADKIRNPEKAKPQAKPTAKPAPRASTDIKRGHSGQDVKNIQRDMNRVFPAYSRLEVDGDFGPATERVIREFQRRVNLKDDGIIGERTKAALRRYGIHTRG